MVYIIVFSTAIQWLLMRLTRLPAMDWLMLLLVISGKKKMQFSQPDHLVQLFFQVDINHS